MPSVVYRFEEENFRGLLLHVSGRKPCKQRSLRYKANIYWVTSDRRDVDKNVTWLVEAKKDLKSQRLIWHTEIWWTNDIILYYFCSTWGIRLMILWSWMVINMLDFLVIFWKFLCTVTEWDRKTLNTSVTFIFTTQVLLQDYQLQIHYFIYKFAVGIVTEWDRKTLHTSVTLIFTTQVLLQDYPLQIHRHTYSLIILLTSLLLVFFDSSLLFFFDRFFTKAN